jgi:hypothetical protein
VQLICDSRFESAINEYQGQWGMHNNKEEIWKICIRGYLREIGWGGMDWIDLAQDRYH